jgi:hypothetical protein
MFDLKTYPEGQQKGSKRHESIFLFLFCGNDLNFKFPPVLSGFEDFTGQKIV